MFLHRRIERGVALLDERRPGWWERIDLDQLDLGNPCNCVLGQEFREEHRRGTFRNSRTPFWFGAIRLNLRTYWSTIRHGFDGFFDRRLTMAWHRRIEEIRRERIDARVMGTSPAPDETKIAAYTQR